MESLLEKQISKLRSQGAKDMDNALMVVQNPKMETFLLLQENKLISKVNSKIMISVTLQLNTQ